MMIRALLRKQLRELGAAFLRSSKTGKARSRASAVGYALLFAVLVVVLMLCFAGMALPLASVLLPALLVSVLASAFTSYSGLFQSRDNELLLSLPIPPAVIFGVRVSTVYLACLIYLLMAWVPAVVCYGLLAARWPGCCAASPWRWCWPERPAFWRYCWAGPWRWPMTAPGTKVWSPWCARWCFLRCTMRVFCGCRRCWTICWPMPHSRVRRARLPSVCSAFWI